MSREVFPLPVTIEEIDCGWLTAALGSRHPGAEVRQVSVTDVINGTCTKIRLRLDLNEAGVAAGIPESVILKGGFETHSREMAYMHEVEVRAYRDLFPVLQLPVPACYFADCDQDKRQGIIIMEDLALRDVVFCDPLVPQSFEAVRRRLASMAAFHAQSWGSAELAESGRWGWQRELFVQLMETFANHLQPEAWQRYMQMPRSAAASQKFQSLDWMKDATRRMAKLASRMPHCMLHGDTHPGNTYVCSDGAPGFFDPVAHKGPGIAEVAYHLVAAVDIADRPRWEGALVQHYLEELGRHGVDAPGFEDAMRCYAAFLPYAYLIWVTNDTFMQTEAVNTAYASRICAAMIDRDSAGLLERMT